MRGPDHIAEPGAPSSACVVAFRRLRKSLRGSGHDAPGPCAQAVCVRGRHGRHAPEAKPGITVVIALRGQLQVESADGVFRVGARRFLALPGTMPIHIIGDARADWVLLQPHDQWLRRLVGHKGCRALIPPVLLPAVLPVDRGIVLRLGELLRQAPHPCDIEAGRQLTNLLLAARAAQENAVDWVRRAYGRSERHRRNAVARLSCARNRIINAPFAAHDLRELAAASKYSPSHFLRSFREVFGVTPSELLTATRLQHAREMIRDGKLSICEIAASVGYESRHSFSRSFKRATGVTATHFRMACNGD